MNSIFNIDEDFNFSDDDLLEVDFFSRKLQDQKNNSSLNKNIYKSKENPRKALSLENVHGSSTTSITNNKYIQKTKAGYQERIFETKKALSYQDDFHRKSENQQGCASTREIIPITETGKAACGNLINSIHYPVTSKMGQGGNSNHLSHIKLKNSSESLKRTYDFLHSKDKSDFQADQCRPKRLSSNHKNTPRFKFSSTNKDHMRENINQTDAKHNEYFDLHTSNQLLSIPDQQKHCRSEQNQKLDYLNNDFPKSNINRLSDVPMASEPCSSSFISERSISGSKHQGRNESNNENISKPMTEQENTDIDKYQSKGCFEIADEMGKKCPGPAGLLPKLNSIKDLDNLKATLPFDSGNIISATKDALPASLFKMAQDEDFQKIFWLNLQKEAIAKSKGMRYLTIDAILKKASENQLEKGKVPVMCALIKSLSYNGPDASIILKDPTGEIHGTVHERICENYERELAIGAGVILSKVSIFSPSNKRHHVNITPSNIMKLVTPEQAESSTQDTELSQRIKQPTPVTETADEFCNKLTEEDFNEKTDLENLFDDEDDDWLDDTGELCS